MSNDGNYPLAPNIMRREIKRLSGGKQSKILSVIWIFHQGCKMSTDKTNTAKGPDEYKLDTTDIIEVLRNNPSPDLLFPELFHEVQIRALFPDSKTFADAVPKSSIEVINSAYKDLNQELDDSNLRHLISQNRYTPIANHQYCARKKHRKTYSVSLVNIDQITSNH